MDARSVSGEPAVHTPRGRLPGLDMLRGIAALCILHYHVLHLFEIGPDIKGKAYLGVDFFFMLSGYVMARTYEHRFATGYTTRQFMVARFWRLWPVMAIGGLIGAPMVLIEFGFSTQAFIVAAANILLIPVLGMNILFPANGAAWTIVGELLANLVHRTLLWRRSIRTLVLALPILLPIIVMTGLESNHLDFGSSQETAIGGMARAVFAYGIGTILFRWWRDHPPLRFNPMLVFVGFPALCLFTQVHEFPGLAFDIPFVLLGCPLLVAGGLCLRGNSLLGQWLGILSFPLYAVHVPILQWTKGLGFSPVTGTVTALVIAVCLALLTDPAASGFRKGLQTGSWRQWLGRGSTLRS
jgi:peptidoglycan/LPS O-acetylase OafA/YrhL